MAALGPHEPRFDPEARRTGANFHPPALPFPEKLSPLGLPKD